ncbi:SCO3242 family prenyltransferase [Streptomyces sp. NPDC051940]|uniref:SCO3242 family prenyltransferase n=1 Tax=Streptomyces sp. NPDC051940 TaxID=3155675 RepID=UPI00343A60CC
MLRLPALFTVPGDALAGAAAAGVRPGRGTALAIGASVCLYEAGMALNDYADREVDAVERPHRPIPSGRIRPRSALTAAVVLTGAGLGLAAAAGRRTLAVGAALAGAVWAYDLRLKETAAGPGAMAAARGLDLLMGAVASGMGPPGSAPLRAAGVLAAHTYAVTAVSRHEARGGSAGAPAAALAATLAIAETLRRTSADAIAVPASTAPSTTAHDVTTAACLAYAGAAVRPYAHAVLNPSAPLTQRAVGSGIKAMLPLQAALTARRGAPVTAGVLLTLIPIARRQARKVSVT